MKKSNQLIIALFAIVMLLMVGYSFAIKAEYDKFDVNDIYRDYTHTALKPFKYVKIIGNGDGLQVNINHADIFELLTLEVISDKIEKQHELIGDTLILYTKINNLDPFKRYTPIFYVTLPSLQHLDIYKSDYNLTNLKGDSLSIIDHSGNGSFKNIEFQNLTVSLNDHASLGIDLKNKITNISLAVSDSSSIKIGSNIFKKFDLDIDSTSNAFLPGGLLKKHFETSRN